jgi:uncharacterized membrane protein YhaH (DUF805 family)
MQGAILDFSAKTLTGVISADDQQHYRFVADEWRATRPPMRGDRVDFLVNEQSEAVQIYLALPTASPQTIYGSQHNTAQNTLLSYEQDQERYSALDWFIQAMKQYVVFSGRSRRKEFWFFMLISCLIGIFSSLIDLILGTGTWVSDISSLIFLLPSIAVGTRRLHDINRSGWWQLIALTGIGLIVLIIWWSTATRPEPNAHGQPAC